MNKMKKIVAVLAVVGMFASVAPTGALTAEELATQIAALQTQLNQLMVQYQQLTGAPAASMPTTCIGVTFTRNLSQGSDGSDVKCLQALLNTDAATQVAATGVGSANNETNYFGSLTQAAVVKFQEKYASEILTPLGLTAGTGFVGASTRAKLNSMLVSAPTTPTTPTDPTEPEVPAGEPAEGTFTATIAASPASNANLTTLSNAPIYGINFKATGSNMRIERIDLQFAITGGAHPATIIRELAIYDGSTLLMEKAITSADFNKVGSDYYVRLTGVGFNVPKDTTKALTVKASFYENLENNRILTVNVYGASGIRGLDTLGLNSWAALATTRVHTIQYTTIGGSTLTGTRSVNTPLISTVKADSTDGVEDVEMLIFNVKSTVGASTITDLTVLAEGTAVDNDKMTAVNLYDGSTLLGSVPLNASDKAVFENLEIVVGKDVTKTLTLKASFTALGAARTASLKVEAGEISYEKPDLSIGTAPAADIEGYVMRLYEDEVAIFKISTPLTVSYTYNSTTPSASVASGTITFKAMADGETMTALTASDITVVATDGTTTWAPSKILTQTPATDIPDGNEAVVTLNVSTEKGVRTGFVYFQITAIGWEVGGNTVAQNWGFTTFKTPVQAW